GARLFTGLGCVACHVAPNLKSDEDETRIALCYAGAKFTDVALVAYLQAPEKHYVWTRMPNFALSDSEARQLGSFLKARSPDNIVAPVDFSKADAKRGEELFNSSGCANCHAPQQKS